MTFPFGLLIKCYAFGAAHANNHYAGHGSVTVAMFRKLWEKSRARALAFVQAIFSSHYESRLNSRQTWRFDREHRLC
jgi:hypothetical protein